ncbi:AraC family transcriptional regulator [Lacrimispora sp.]|uniref:helix-turn-helix transcriptional regulator n=1 Tax=Lacrimispora sp. TaxID=2719234 RepID=UPI0032E4F62E
MNEQIYHGKLVNSNRILYTASRFAKEHLVYLQEVGELHALKQHISRREQLNSFLFFIILDGEGTLQVENEIYSIGKGYCVFIDCQNPYSHKSSKEHPWHLFWVHFYGPTMEGIYKKYMIRGGQPCYQTDDMEAYRTILQTIYQTAKLDSHVRDMIIFEKLAALLTMTMIESHRNETYIERNTLAKTRLLNIKSYLDAHYTEKISLSNLEQKFYINKYYLTRIFKENFGISINSYLIQKRITQAKYELRFTDKTIEEIGHTCGMADASYFNRVFKKIEGISPREFRKLWSRS